MGTGGEFSLARKAMEEEKDVIRQKLEGFDLVFLLAGLGGGTGGGATPVIAKIERGRCLGICIYSMPFRQEKGRHSMAEDCLDDLRKHANAVIPLPNDSLLQMGGPDATTLECFAEAGRNVSQEFPRNLFPCFQAWNDRY